MNALFLDFAHGTQAEHLKAARIGQYWALPTHELMQAAKLFHDVQAWAHPQMKGVAQNNLGIDLVQIARRHAFHGAVGAHRHEDGCLNNTMCGGDFTATGLARRGFELERQCAQGKSLFDHKGPGFRSGRILNHFKHMGLKTTF